MSDFEMYTKGNVNSSPTSHLQIALCILLEKPVVYPLFRVRFLFVIGQPDKEELIER